MDYEMDYLDELLFDEPAEDNDADLLPAYLREPPIPTRTYGTLSYNRRSKCWTVKGDPSVTEKTVALPRTIHGKPVRLVCLNRLWGIAL